MNDQTKITQGDALRDLYGEPVPASLVKLAPPGQDRPAECVTVQPALAKRTSRRSPASCTPKLVMPVVPVMLTSLCGIAALCAQLRQHQIATPEAEAQFALLSDWADAPTAEVDGDADLIRMRVGV